MPNVFDQFDDAQDQNVFDQFDDEPDVPKRPLSFPAQIGEGIASVASSVLAEPIAGLIGGSLTPFGVETANRALEGTRDFLTVEAESPVGQKIVGGFGTGAEFVTKVARAPVAALASASIDEDFETGRPSRGRDGRSAEQQRALFDRIMNEGIGPVFGEPVAEVTGSPFLGAVVATIPTAILTVLGLKGANRLSQRQLQGVKQDVARTIKQKGLDPTDTSPQNIARIRESLVEDLRVQQARIDDFNAVGIESPTRAQVTRRADDFQRQQELGKQPGKVRTALEEQEAILSRRFDTAVSDTAGRPVTSGSTIVDEVVGRSTLLDNRIGELYRRAREIAPEGGTFKPQSLVDALDQIVPSDRAMKGLPNSIRGNLKVRGIIDKDGNILRRVSVAEAEEIRIFINSHFESTSVMGRTSIRSLKDALDNDVFKAAGRDIFDEARTAKAQFETELSAAKISKFDKNKKNLVRDILENKIDPDVLVERITMSKSYRASDLKKLRDYLQQTDSGIAAFDDLRAQTLQNIKDKAFFGPEDAQGVRALSRDKLQKSLDQIGKERMEVLFTIEERRLLNKILRVAKLREPVRGTALGRGPSAQAVSELQKSLTKGGVISNLIDRLFVRRDGTIVLQGKVQPIEIGRPLTAPAALAAPLAAGQATSE